MGIYEIITGVSSMCTHDDTGKTFRATFANSNRTLTTNASIWTAAELGDAERVRMVVTVKGRKPDSLDPHGYTPLHLAAQSEWVEKSAAYQHSSARLPARCVLPQLRVSSAHTAGQAHRARH